MVTEPMNKSGPARATCIRFSHFYPFLGYLLPTLLITYGVVVPGSCIVGVNAETVGFGAAMVAAGLAQWLGIRLALQGRSGLQLHHWIPVIAFLALASVIGYGFVIPGSCISGINAHSIGFAVSLLFATVAYSQGIRKALSGAQEHAP